jgi:hypothetical protein
VIAQIGYISAEMDHKLKNFILEVKKLEKERERETRDILSFH